MSMMQLKPTSIVLMVFILIGLSSCQQSQDADSRPSVEPLEIVVTEAVEPTETAVVPEGENALSEDADINQVNDDWIFADYQIVPGESTARFELDENLKSSETGWHTGTRVTVVGTTDQVFGSFSFSPSELNATQLDDIRIDANTFSTDKIARTFAIRRTVLDTSTYPEVVFLPTEVRGLPETVQIGEEVVFNLDGELTIRDVSLPQSFVVTATLVSPNRVEGTAATVVTRESYGLEIRVALHVTDVEDEVELYIDFVALSE